MLRFALVCFAKVCEYSVLPNAMKDPLLIVRFGLQFENLVNIVLEKVVKNKLVKTVVTSMYWQSW